VRLVGQVVTVSLETMKIVRSLPALDDAMKTTTPEKPRTPLAEQIAELKKLGKGWHEPDTPAPDPETLDRFAAFLGPAAAAAGLGEPFLYPSLEGGAQAEWPVKGWDLSATVEPRSDDILVHASEIPGDRDDETLLTFRDSGAPRAFAEFVAGLGRGSPTRPSTRKGR